MQQLAGALQALQWGGDTAGDPVPRGAGLQGGSSQGKVPETPNTLPVEAIARPQGPLPKAPWNRGQPSSAPHSPGCQGCARGQVTSHGETFGVLSSDCYALRPWRPSEGTSTFPLSLVEKGGGAVRGTTGTGCVSPPPSCASPLLPRSPLQACRSPLRAGVGAPAQSPPQPLLLSKKLLMSRLSRAAGGALRCLGLCAWEGLVSWRQEPPREPAFWGPEPLERAGGRWRGGQQSSSVGGWLRVAGTRIGGAVSWLESRGGQSRPTGGLLPMESHSFRPPALLPFRWERGLGR